MILEDIGRYSQDSWGFADEEGWVEMVNLLPNIPT